MSVCVLLAGLSCVRYNLRLDCRFFDGMFIFSWQRRFFLIVFKHVPKYSMTVGAMRFSRVD